MGLENRPSLVWGTRSHRVDGQVWIFRPFRQGQLLMLRTGNWYRIGCPWTKQRTCGSSLSSKTSNWSSAGLYLPSSKCIYDLLPNAFVTHKEQLLISYLEMSSFWHFVYEKPLRAWARGRICNNGVASNLVRLVEKKQKCTLFECICSRFLKMFSFSIYLFFFFSV